MSNNSVVGSCKHSGGLVSFETACWGNSCCRLLASTGRVSHCREKQEIGSSVSSAVLPPNLLGSSAATSVGASEPVLWDTLVDRDPHPPLQCHHHHHHRQNLLEGSPHSA